MPSDEQAVQFSEACGFKGPLRLNVRDLGGSECSTHVFPWPFVVIGSDERADLVLDRGDVSPRHAYLQGVDGRLFCLALSRCPVAFAGGTSAYCGWVPAQGIQIGQFHIRPEGADTAGASSLPFPTSRAYVLPDAADVRIERSDLVKHTWQASRVLVLVGRSIACRIRFSGRDVASLHAALVRTAEGCWVIDLLGRPHGTAVNGTGVRAARLRDGDEVRVGSHAFRIGLGARSTTAELLPLNNPSGPRPGSMANLDPSLAVVMDEIQRMELQNADQVNRALLAMLQLFSRMHQDQMALLREELEELRTLGDEHRTVRARLAALAPVPSQTRQPTLRVVGGSPTAQVVPQQSFRSDPTQDEVHLKLMRRLAAIGQEREGRVHRLLGAILGKTGPEGPR